MVQIVTKIQVMVTVQVMNMVSLDGLDSGHSSGCGYGSGFGQVRLDRLGCSQGGGYGLGDPEQNYYRQKNKKVLYASLCPLKHFENN